MTKRQEIREFLIIPLIFISLMILLFFLKDKITGPLGNIFFPIDNSIIEQTKYFFTPMTIIIIIEYLLSYEMPENYLFSRVLSLIVVILLMISFNLIYSVFSREINPMIYLPFFIIFLFAGQLSSYLIQKTMPIKMGFIISFSMFVLISFLISFLTFTFPAI